MKTQTERLEELKPRLTDEFLDTLAEYARIVGWRYDSFEIDPFVESCFEEAGKPVPNLDHYHET